MRDPLKRLWSHTKFHLQVTGQLEALEAWGPTEFEDFVRSPFIWDNAEYGRVLRNLRAGLSREAWRAVFYEEMHADQRGTLAGIEDFLGVSRFDYPQDLLDRRVTQSVHRPMPGFFPDLFAQDMARIKAEVRNEGYALPKTWD